MNLAEFGDWGLKQGSVANPPPDNWFKGQCVSLIQQYLYRVFGKSFKAYGNAKDWATNYPKDYFKKMSKNTKLQPGDVLVYGANYGGGYGHIALIDVNGNFYDQNGIKAKKVAYRSKPFSGYVCVLRPINQKKLGLETKTQSKSYRFAVGQAYTTQVYLKIRAGAGKDKRQKNRSELTADAKKHSLLGVKACLKKGTKVTCLEIKEIGKDIWIRIPSGWIAGYYDNKVYIK